VTALAWATRFIRARSGATLPEFAFVAVPFIVLVMGGLDLGYQSYLRATVTGALEKAARKATVGNRTRAQVIQMIDTEVRAVLTNSSKADASAVVVTPQSYYNFSSVGGGERITGDTAPVGTYNAGDCYEDRNSNGRYDASGGGGADLGTADDIVYYTVAVRVPRLFPIAGLMGGPTTTEATARTLIRNQPYGAQQVIIRCS
jgi:Flp pilus assembly protein TadG